LKNVAEKAEAYLHAHDSYGDALQAARHHSQLKEPGHAAVAAVRAIGWLPVSAWRSTVLVRAANKEGLAKGETVEAIAENVLEATRIDR
jgi:hypothetical protein